MAKGVSIKFKSYSESVPKLLEVIKLDSELKKHKSIVLKPTLKNSQSTNTKPAFLEQVLRFCISHKGPDAQIFIAEGSDGAETPELFESEGYKALAERYGVGLIDLNTAETEEVIDGNFMKFERIHYPKLLLESFIIAVPHLAEDKENDMQGALSSMLGAFPAEKYRGLFSSGKSKIRKWPIKYSVHDILRCKMPDLAIIDASDKGAILAGIPLDTDIAAARLLGKDEKSVGHLRLVKERLSEVPQKASDDVESVST